MMSKLTLLLLCVVLTATTSLPPAASSQTITDVIGIDSESWPHVSLRFFSADNRAASLSVSDVRVAELTGACPVVSVTPQRSLSDSGASVLFVVSVASQAHRIASVEALRAALDAVALPESEVAVVSCDDGPFVVQDFTRDRQRVNQAVDALVLRTEGQTRGLFDDPVAGVFALLAPRQHRRMAIIVTDAAMTSATDTASIVAWANRERIALSTVTLDRADDGIAASLAARSGGWYRRVSSADAPAAIRKALFERRYEPAVITWRSPVSCELVRDTRLAIVGDTSDHAFTVELPESARVIVESIPYSIRFPSRPSVDGDTTVRIVARRGRVVVMGLISSDSAFTVRWPDGGPPFTLDSGDALEVGILYRAIDSAYRFASFRFVTEACIGNELYAVAGLDGVRAASNTLRLTKPNGGEVLLAGDSTDVVWSGIGDSDTARIAVSTDGGDAWAVVERSADRRRYSWRVPPTETTRGRLRIGQQRDGDWRRLYRPPEGSGQASEVGFVDFNPDGRRVLFGSQWSDAVVQDIHSGRLTLAELPRQAWNARWSPDGRGIVVATTVGVLLRNGSTGSITRTISAPDFVSDAALSPDGALLAFTTLHNHEGGYANVIRLSTGAWPIRVKLRGYWVRVEFDRSGRYLAVSDLGGYVTMIDVVERQFLWEVPYRNRDESDSWLAFAPDRDVLYVASDSIVRMYDVTSGRLLDSLKTAGRNPRIAFSRDGRYLAVRSWRSHAEVFETSTKRLVRRVDFTERNGGASHWSDPANIDFSPDGTLIGFGTGDGQLIITPLDTATPEIQSDVSDSTFTIVVARPTIIVREVDLGEVPINGVRDTVVAGVLVNSSAFPVRDIRLDVAGVSNASILSGGSTAQLAPGEALAVHLRYGPTAEEVLDRWIAMRTRTDTILAAIHLKARAVRGSVASGPAQRWVGDVDLGGSIDTVLPDVLRNRGLQSVAIRAVEVRGPDSMSFRATMPAQIEPGSTAAMRVHFEPGSAGVTSSRIAIYHDAPGSPTIVTLSGEGRGGHLYIAFGQLDLGEAFCDATKDSVVSVYNDGNEALDVRAGMLAGDSASSFAVSPQALSIAPGGSAGLTIRLLKHGYDSLHAAALVTPVAPGVSTDSVVVRLAARRTMLAYRIDRPTLERLPDSTAIVNDGGGPLSWPDTMMVGAYRLRFAPNVTMPGGRTTLHVELVGEGTGDGRIVLPDVACDSPHSIRIGDLRRLDTLSFGPAVPSPASDHAVIDVTTIERGRTIVELLDARGARVAMLLDKEMTPGHIRLPIDVKGLASGAYRILLRTPTTLRSIPIVVVR